MWRDFDDRLDRRLFGSAGGVSSWNDLTDKPFGEEACVVEMVAECTVTTEENSYTPPAVGIFSDNPELVEGNAYKVVFDGEEYECVAFFWSTLGSGSFCLGNGTILGPSPVAGNGEPFVIDWSPGSSELCLYTTEPSTHTVSIRQETETIHTIDPKYLPEVSGGGGAFVVNFATEDMQNWTADKTFAEVANAVSSGKEVYGSVLGLKVDFIGVMPNGSAIFGRIIPDGSKWQSYHFAITEDDSVDATMAYVQATSLGGDAS